jgi:hypothetical protein
VHLASEERAADLPLELGWAPRAPLVVAQHPTRSPAERLKRERRRNDAAGNEATDRERFAVQYRVLVAVRGRNDRLDRAVEGRFAVPRETLGAHR